MNVMRLFLILLLFISSIAYAKSKLIIRKCLTADGTISYQEKRCDTNVGVSKNHIPKKQVMASKQPKVNTLTSWTKTPSNNYSQPQPKLRYQKLSNLVSHDLSTQIISDRVKSDRISIQVLSRWSMIKKVYNNKLLHMKFLDETPKSELSLLIDFTDPQGKSFNNSELVNLSNLIGSRFARGSQEGQVNAKILKVKGGLGAMVFFTNSELVKEYNYISKGLIYKNNWLIQFTLLTDSIDNSSYHFAINALLNDITIQKI